jgi:hypothetical protein
MNDSYISFLFLWRLGRFGKFRTPQTGCVTLNNIKCEPKCTAFYSRSSQTDVNCPSIPHEQTAEIILDRQYQLYIPLFVFFVHIVGRRVNEYQ